MPCSLHDMIGFNLLSTEHCATALLAVVLTGWGLSRTLQSSLKVISSGVFLTTPLTH